MDLGIKVLSLFFIDKVEKYRREDGSPGIYAEMFESCYRELMAKPKYEALRNRFISDVSKVHNGYFSQDKKGRLKDTKGDTAADDDTYNTIMRDKEWLLSFECPLRFIFSHSTLKEGWDNPNVFQVCTLIEQKSTFTCRQKVGRGLRLCVNQDGQEYYVQEIFDTTELLANLDRNAVKVEHSVYDYVVYDSSTVEKPVAVALDNDPDVKMFFKIPSRFKIETPIGTYNPDWAVYLNKNGEEKLYFVLETKGDTSFMHLKTSEQLKIHCGKEHFKALDAGVELETATSWTELRKRI